MLKYQGQGGDMTIQSQSLTKGPDLLMMFKQLSVLEEEMDRMKRKEAYTTIQFNDYKKNIYQTIKELEAQSDFSYQCIMIQNLLQKMEDLVIGGNEFISGNKDNMWYQVVNIEATCMEILSNEQEIERFINYGKDILIESRKNDASNIMKIIDAVEKRWLKIRQTSNTGRTRMDTCKENFKKFYGAQDMFLPWLGKAENRISKMKTINMTITELKKQEKEFQNFRNDVNKHEAEFDYNVNVGDSFQAACDTDKEIVKGEIGHMKERWEKLNHFISERAQYMADIFTKLGDSNETVKELEH